MSARSSLPNGERRSALYALLQYLKNHAGPLLIAVEDKERRRQLAVFDLAALQPVTTGDAVKDAILAVLREAGHRLTTDGILAGLGKAGHSWSDATVKARLSDMVEEELLDNDQKARPKGYGIVGGV